MTVRSSDGVSDAAADLVKSSDRSSSPVSMWELVSFTVPMLGVGLATPLLSLVDSAVVGRCGSAMQLASMGPATALCDCSAYIFLFLAVTTTNLVANARARGDVQGEERAVRNGLTFALGCGSALGAFLLLASEGPLRLLAGKDASALMLGARAYTGVRALGMPAGFALLVLQAAALGVKDWLAPSLAVVVAVLANVLADLFFVAVLGLGVVGAAIGTILSQIGAAATLFYLRYSRAPRDAPSDANGVMPTPLAYVQQQWRLRPTADEVWEWVRFGAPLSLGQVARVCTMWLVTSTCAASGAIGCAAHQVSINIFYLFTTFGDAVSQTGQAYLPAVTGGGQARSMLRWKLLCLGGLTAAATAAMALLPLALPSLTAIFTTDTALRAAILRLLPLLSACALAYVGGSTAEGVLIASRDTAFVGRLYAFGPPFTALALAVLGPALGRGTGSAWLAFAIWNACRFATFANRLRSV